MNNQDPTTTPFNEFDFDAVDPAASDALVAVYPLAQWVNGKKPLAALKNVAYTGGLLLPVRYMRDGMSLPGWSPVELTFGNGQSEAGVAAQEVTIAAISVRFR